MNKAPEWIQGTFVWRVMLPDGKDSMSHARDSIRAVQNMLDLTVRSCVFINGFLGSDESRWSWDGVWPYIIRPTYRTQHSWKSLEKFMLDMRDNHNAWISFHINITDVNVGLRAYPETRAFFERLRSAQAIYTRDGDGCGVQLKGPAYVPQRIPYETAKMPYVPAGDPMDIFAIVNYDKMWKSGIAKEMVDTLYENLPYPPLILYLDVLTTTGSNLTAGLPDGILGGSEETQREGRRKILEYIKSKGSEPGGESPSWWTRYNWNHGGMSANDYSRIETGWSQGCMSWRGAEWQHVYGNQGAYTLDLDGKILASNMQYVAIDGGGTAIGNTESGDNNAPIAETAEARTLPQIIEGFYLTVIQELFHIGLGNLRLPAGNGINRIDEHCGRLVLDRMDAWSLRQGWCNGMQASDGDLTKPCTIESDRGSTNGKVVTNLDGSLSGRCKVTLEVCNNYVGDGYLVIRYASPKGGTAEIEVNGESIGEVSFPATTERPGIFSDLAIPVNWKHGANTITISKGRIYARWSDGTEAKWDRNGFSARNGDMVYGVGYDRMWPDTWSGHKKIYFYSKTGTQRRWKLPESWREYKKVSLYPLTFNGRGDEAVLDIKDGYVSPLLLASTPYVLEPDRL